MCAPMKERRYRPGVAVVDGKIYVLGGEEGWDRWERPYSDIQIWPDWISCVILSHHIYKPKYRKMLLNSKTFVRMFLRAINWFPSQVSWHYRAVLWGIRQLGDRRWDAHQSQLAQLCLTAAEEGHSRGQPSWHGIRDRVSCGLRVSGHHLHRNQMWQNAVGLLSRARLDAV